jgi:hypothetical protein
VTQGVQGVGGSGSKSKSGISRDTAKVGSGDPAAPCDRFDPTACAKGEECRAAIRKAPSAQTFDVYSGCFGGVESLGRDAACRPWGGRTTRYQKSGLTAEVYVDPCGDRLVCTDDLLSSGNFRCRPSCDFDRRWLCDKGQFCYSGAATVYEQACLVNDRCDPTKSDVCGKDNGCYLRPNDTATGLITVCLPVVSPMPLEDGAACESTFDCKPGSWCWGPAAQRPREFTDRICRRTCALDATVGAVDACPAPTVCKDLEAAKKDLDFSQVPVPLGQCE